MSDTFVYVLLFVLGLILLYIMILGFLFLLAMASEQGFIGLAVLVACYFFMFPVMIGLTAIIGLVIAVKKLFSKEI